jgi:uncharacterized OB-fold protein
MSDLAPPMPHPTPITEPFWNGLVDHKVMLQQCSDCDSWVFYPRSHCSTCLSPNLTWKEVSGEGEIYSYTIAHRPTAPQFRGQEPQWIAVVELAEGVRLNSVIVNANEADLKVGLKVRPYFESDLGDRTLLHFQPR